MTGEVLLHQEEYSILRRESREALHRLGTPSNPGFTNTNIVESLGGVLGYSREIPEEIDTSEYSGEIFRDSLGEILGLELPPLVSEVVSGLRSLSQ